MLIPTLVFLFFSLVFAQNSSTLEEDLASVGVSVLFPDDDLFDSAAKPYNPRFSYAPVAIAYPTNSEEVAAALLVGVQHGLNVAARSGGHSYIANGLGGRNGSLVLDLSSITAITVDDDGTAVVGVGNRLGNVATGLNEYGRGIPHGRCTYVGLGGHAAFGGYGFTSRMWGLTIDAIVSIEVVLADGSIVTANEAENEDLFWALRGSASSFGITTFITFATHPVPEYATFATYTWLMDIANSSKAISDFQAFADTDIPATLGTEIFIFRGQREGTLRLQLLAGYFSSPETFNATMAPFLSLQPAPIFSTYFSGNYINGLSALAFGSLNTSGPNPSLGYFYMKSLLTPEAELITPEAMETFITYLAVDGYRLSSRISWQVEVEIYGGSNSAINKVSLDSTAFAHRSSRFNMQLGSAVYQTPFPEEAYTYPDGMASTLINSMPSDWEYGAYTNYIDERLDNWQDLYYGEHYQRLQDLKAIYDPQNVFNFPTSIE